MSEVFRRRRPHRRRIVNLEEVRLRVTDVFAL
jgi:hypothetical protein